MNVQPFTSFVGQDELKLALILNAIDSDIGGVLIRGPKGTGKSSIVRSFVDILPEIKVVKDCPFNCDPEDQSLMCDNCKRKKKKGNSLVSVRKKMKIINLPLGTTEDRLLGTIDIEKILKEKKKEIEPGILGYANRNILYIDEVNLLPDHLTDDILDASALGVNYIEREGVSFTHPARFILVGTMNPEEGELRPQILDRFALSVDVKNLEDNEMRKKVIERHIEFKKDPVSFNKKFEKEQNNLRKKIKKAREIIKDVKINHSISDIIASLCGRLEMDGMRPDIVMTKAAIALAAFKGRKKVIKDDILTVALLSLKHRTRKGGALGPPSEQEILKVLNSIIKKN